MEKMLVLDFGGQYAHLIARRLRNLGYFSEIALPDIDTSDIKNVKGIILSGGPSSVYDKNAPFFNNKILQLNIPILGLCYGHQLIIKEYGGVVENTGKGEYGYSLLNKISDSPLFAGVEFPSQVWMSHSDTVTKIPEEFELIGSTDECKFAAVQSITLNRFSLQFHPEVVDTVYGNKMLGNFVSLCGMNKNWDDEKLLSIIKERIIKEARDKKILLFLSGGVDSSVSYSILSKTLGSDRVLGLYINNGFMRKNETEIIKRRYKNEGFKNVMYENFEEVFLDAVKGVIDPQQKRKIIGETFLKVKDEIIKRLKLNEDEWLLAQGTLYPDIIESGGSKHSSVIKTHHNRVEGIKELLEKGLVIEPLKELYKDEVRKLGKKLGLNEEIINRQPFPGPGISINLLCSDGKINKVEFNATYEKIKELSLAKFFKDRFYKISILPVKSVGIQGDFRTYNYPVVLEIAGVFDEFIGWDKLELVSSHISNNVKEINRIVIQIFKKSECSLIEAFCTKDRLDMIREIDHIFMNEIKESDKYKEIFQHLTINLPYASKKESCSIVLRPVVSEDVMTARFAKIDLSVLKPIINKIEKLDFVDALFYDITNKPPATFGWE